MIFGPVFRHELRAAGRKRRFFHARVVIGALLLLAFWVVYEAAASEPARFDDGRLSIAGASFVSAVFYQAFARITLYAVLLLTPAVAAGAIASERERRTIEYLFATDLSNGEIVLDKLLARLMTVGAMLVSTVPVLAIFRLLGGVPGELLVTHFALLAASAAVAGSLALCVGAYCERARDATQLALGWTLAWLLAAPVGAGLFAALSGRVDPISQWVLDHAAEPLVGFLFATNPISVQERALGLWDGVLGLDFDVRRLLTSIGLLIGVAAALLALCVRVVRRVHLRSVSRGAGPSAGRSAERRSRRRPPSDLRPLLWKEMHAASVRRRSRSWRAKAIRVIGYLAFIGFALTPIAAFWLAVWSLAGPWAVRGATYDLGDYLEVTCSLGATLGPLLVVAAGARASGLITNERERETWLSLLTTPRSGADILFAKLLGNLWAFRWPAGLLVAMPALGVFLGWEAVLGAIWASVATAVPLAITVTAASAIGLAISLRCASSTKASALSVFALFGVSGLYPLLALVLLMLTRTDENALWILSAPAFVPMLIGLPPAFAVQPPEGQVVAGLALGMMGYAALAWLVMTAAVRDFDRVCGRGWKRPTRTPPKVAAAGTVG